MTIYPAIDLRGGRCVRLFQGKADQETVYFENPVEPANLWREAGATNLHVVDLDGAFTGSSENLDAVRENIKPIYAWGNNKTRKSKKPKPSKNRKTPKNRKNLSAEKIMTIGG